MTQVSHTAYGIYNIILDIFIYLISLFSSLYLRFNLKIFNRAEDINFYLYIKVMLFAMLVFILINYLCEVYSYNKQKLHDIILNNTKSNLYFLIFITSVLYFFKLVDISRQFLILFFFLNLLFVIIGRIKFIAEFCKYSIGLAEKNNSPMEELVNYFVKRSFDCVVSLICIILISPIFIIEKLYIGIGNILKENSRNDKSICVADKYKDKNIKKYLSIFIDILKGKMSVIGCSSEKRYDVNLFNNKNQIIKEGLIQISDFYDEMYYIENWSIKFDLRIILMKSVDNSVLLYSKTKKVVSILKDNKYFQIAKNCFALVGVPLVILISSEMINKINIKDLLVWMYSKTFVANYIIVFSVVLIAYMIFNNLFIGSLIISALIELLSIINYYKAAMLSQPLYPSDLLLSTELTNITGTTNIKFNFTIFLCVIVLLLMLILLCKIYNLRIKAKSRIIILVITNLLLFSFISKIVFDDKILNAVGATNILWDQKKSYQQNGFVLNFVMNTRNLTMKKPQKYNKETIYNIVKNIPEQIQNKNDNIKPNIIMIMSESFWDVTRLKNINFKVDPIKNINKLKESSKYGNVISPIFGGGTCNAEFEALTGFSNFFLPNGTIPYQQYIKRPIASIASYLKNNGYNTIAVHPYEKWFWNRESVYKLLGFDRFISKEDFKDPEIKGYFISDKEACREIIKQYEINRDKPSFIFMVSMQNHESYENDRYGKLDIVNGNLDSKSKQILNTYTQGIIDADEAFGYVTDYFKSVDRPTIVIMFGDHAPILGDDFYAYRKAGFLPEGQLSSNDFNKLLEVPFIMWKNYDSKPLDLGTFGDNYIGVLALKEAGIALPGYYRYLDNSRSVLPAFTHSLILDKGGDAAINLTEEQQNLMDENKLLQYDEMFGKQYGKNKLFN